MNLVDPTGLLTQTEDELQEVYDNLSDEEKQRESGWYKFWDFFRLADVLNIEQYYTIDFDDWTREQRYSSVVGDNDITYYYKNTAWANGGDVITHDGISYIHHDDSYTLIQLPGVQGGEGITHAFNNEFDPNGELDNERMNPTVVRAARELVFRYHIIDRENPLYISEGYRSPETQQRYYNQGRTTPGNVITWVRPWYSWHQYGLALDIVFQNGNGGPSWAEGNPWNRLGTVGEQVGFTWGGRWNTPDRPHFEMTGNLNRCQEALDIYNQYSHLGRQRALEMVWEAMRRRRRQL